MALPVSSVTFVVPRTRMSPLKSKLPSMVRSPSTIRMPAPLALPFALMVRLPPVKCVICGAAVVPMVALPLIWVVLLSGGRGRARRSLIIWLSRVVLGAAGEVFTLGTMGGPFE